MTANDAGDRALRYCVYKGWARDWSNGGCYLHLEASELIEALRGKGGDPQKELGDVLFVLFSVARNKGLDIDAAIQWVGEHKLP